MTNRGPLKNAHQEFAVQNAESYCRPFDCSNTLWRHLNHILEFSSRHFVPVTITAFKRPSCDPLSSIKRDQQTGERFRDLSSNFHKSLLHSLPCGETSRFRYSVTSKSFSPSLSPRCIPITSKRRLLHPDQMGNHRCLLFYVIKSARWP